jgi:hypothetical protein
MLLFGTAIVLIVWAALIYWLDPDGFGEAGARRSSQPPDRDASARTGPHAIE